MNRNKFKYKIGMKTGKPRSGRSWFDLLFRFAGPALLLALLLAGCSDASAPKSNQGKLVDIFSNLDAFATNANLITINYNWHGLSAIAPISAVYVLERKSQVFEVAATFNMTFNMAMLNSYVSGSPRTKNVEEKRTLTIPVSDVAQFLQKLVNTPVEPGPYRGTPLPEYTDNYPSINISITTPSGILSFSSKSQIENFFPWTVDYAGRTYTATDATPFEAFSFLNNPYLKLKETFAQISDKELAVSTPPTTR